MRHNPTSSEDATDECGELPTDDCGELPTDEAREDLALRGGVDGARGQPTLVSTRSNPVERVAMKRALKSTLCTTKYLKRKIKIANSFCRSLCQFRLELLHRRRCCHRYFRHQRVPKIYVTRHMVVPGKVCHPRRKQWTEAQHGGLGQLLLDCLYPACLYPAYCTGRRSTRKARYLPGLFELRTSRAAVLPM